MAAMWRWIDHGALLFGLAAWACGETTASRDVTRDDGGAGGVPHATGGTTGSGGADTGGAAPTGGAAGNTGADTGGAAPTGGADSGADCMLEGVVHGHGSSWTATDGCNTCGCTDGLVQCTALWCDPVDAGVGGAAFDAGTVDPRVLDVWYFDVPTGAVRWYEIALCNANRALVWTSFGGSGEPDQANPIGGTWQGSGTSVTVLYDDPSVAGTPQVIELAYDPATDTLATVSIGSGLGGTGVRLAPLSSVTYRLSCE
jgi:hypothetical protein